MQRPDLTLIQLTDLHILPSADDRLYGEDTLANAQRAVDAVAASGLTPAGFLMTGDLANNGEMESYARLRSFVDEVQARFKVPVLPALGNHDARQAFRAAYLGEGSDANDAPYHYVGSVDDLRVIVLDPIVPGRPNGKIAAEQLDWLRAQLREAAPAGTLLVIHHPPLPGPVPILNYLILQEPGALAAIIAGTDVIGILSGHVHHPTVGTFAGVTCWAGPATAFTVDPLYHGADGSGFRAIAGTGFSLIHLYGRTLVPSAVSLPSDGRELHRYELAEDKVRQWLGAAEPAAAAAG
jgi:3',5'-cyclic AMP phosphodiesterase CpdA